MRLNITYLILSAEACSLTNSYIEGKSSQLRINVRKIIFSVTMLHLLKVVKQAKIVYNNHAITNAKMKIKAKLEKKTTGSNNVRSFIIT